MTESTLVEVPIKVEKDYHGLRLDQYLALRFPKYSRTQVQKMIGSRIKGIGNKSVKKSTLVSAGDEIILLCKKIIEPVLDIELETLYEDEHLIVVNKPADIIMHPSNGRGVNSLVNLLKRRFENTPYYPYLVHRLDRDTSGIALVAKTREAARSLYYQFTRREVEKVYIAIVSGDVEHEGGIIDLPIRKAKPFTPLECHVRKHGDGIGGKILTGFTERMLIDKERGSPAFTEYRVDKRLCGVTMMRIFPRTGRMHQIRVHLAAMGHPIVGDRVYYNDESKKLQFPRQALHASSLRFIHPAKKEPMKLECPIPQDMAEFISALEKGS